MITVFDMETGELVERGSLQIAQIGAVASVSARQWRPEPALQALEADRPALRMPAELALVDSAEILARFR